MPVAQDPWARCGPADRKIIEDLQGATVPVAPDEVIRVLHRHYTERGRQTALIDQGGEWAYKQLGDRVRGLGAWLDKTYASPRGQGRRVFAVAIAARPILSPRCTPSR